MGTACSLILMVVLIVYAGYKTSILQHKKSVDILQAVQKYHFDDDYVFGAEQGLNIAAAVVNLNGSSVGPIDPTYGRLVFNKFNIGLGDNGNVAYESKELASHLCSSEELGLSGTEHKFWPIKPQKKKALELLKDSLMCLDSDADLKIQGDVDSEKNQIIQVNVRKCTGREDCKTDEEIEAYFAVR